MIKRTYRATLGKLKAIHKYWEEMAGKAKVKMRKKIDKWLAIISRKCYELSRFLSEYRKALKRKIVGLRLKKSLRAHEGNASTSYIELVESEIRSFCLKYYKLDSPSFKFGDPLAKRLEGRSSQLKSKVFDEMHFTCLDKSDFIVHLRMLLTEQRVTFGYCVMKEIISVRSRVLVEKVKEGCLNEVGTAIKEREAKEAQAYIIRKKVIEEELAKKEIEFFYEGYNIIELELFLNALNYMKAVNQPHPNSSKNQSKYSQRYQNLKSSEALNHSKSPKHPQQHYTYYSIETDYSQPPFIPSNEAELSEILLSICSKYFSAAVTDRLLDQTHTSREHLIYKLNSFVAILLRTIGENCNFVVQVRERDLDNLRSTVQRELETIFAQDVAELFNTEAHQVVGLVNEGSYEVDGELTRYEEKSERKEIFLKYFSVNILVDPLSKSIFDFVSATTDRNGLLKSVLESVVGKVRQHAASKIENIYQYNRLCQRESNIFDRRRDQLAELIERKLKISSEIPNANHAKFIGIINYKLNGSKCDENLLKSAYSLCLLRCVQSKQHLLAVLNAQISIMYRTGYRLRLIRHKHELPFDMDPEFIARYMEDLPSSEQNRFCEEGRSDRTEMGSKYPDPQHNDKIFRVRTTHKAGSKLQSLEFYRVEVRRMNPNIPIFYGKQILYEQSLEEVEAVLERLLKTCSLIICSSEQTVDEGSQQLTFLVDRIRLISYVLQLEAQYQSSKLQLLEVYDEILGQSCSSEGIDKISAKMYEVKGKQFYHDLTNANTFSESYRLSAEGLDSQASILRHFSLILIKQERREYERYREDILRSNHCLNTPDLSSIYFSDELPMEKGEDVIEEDDEEGLSELSGSQVFSANNRAGTVKTPRSDLSGMSSEYQVKSSFKQVLGKNSLQGVRDEFNGQKKEELMGCKKKRLVNDSVLGGLISGSRTEQQKYLEYVHLSLELLEQVGQYFRSNYRSEDLRLEAVYYRVMLSCVKSSRAYEEYVPIIKENSLPEILAESNRTISKLLSTIIQSQSQPQSQPHSYEHYLFVSREAFQSVLDNSTKREQVDELRGLYILLNCVDLAEKHFRHGVGALVDAEVKNCVMDILGRYSRELATTTREQYGAKYFILPQEGFLLMPEHSKLKSQSHLTELLTRHRNLLPLSLYYTFLLANMELAKNLSNYYRSVLDCMLDDVSEYCQVKMQVTALYCYDSYLASAGCDDGYDDAATVLGFLKAKKSGSYKIYLSQQMDNLRNKESDIFTHKKISKILLDLPLQIINQVSENPEHKSNTLSEDTPNFLSNETVRKKSLYFEAHIESLHEAALQLYICSRGMQSTVLRRREVVGFRSLIRMLPQLDRQICVVPLPQPLFESLFGEVASKRTLLRSENAEVIYCDGFEIGQIAGYLDLYYRYVGAARTVLKNMARRVFAEFQLPDPESHLRKYEEYFDLQLSHPSHPLARSDLSDIFNEFESSIKKWGKIREWLELKLIMFGCTIQEEELLQLRMMMGSTRGGYRSFEVFYKGEDSVTHLIREKEIFKMLQKHGPMAPSDDQAALYKQRQQSTADLKDHYKSFLEQMAEVDIHRQAHENTLWLYLADCYFFRDGAEEARQGPEYLHSYGFANRPQSRLDVVVVRCKANNFRGSKQRFDPIAFKTRFWREQGRQAYLKHSAKAEQKDLMYKEHLNKNNSKMLAAEYAEIAYKTAKLAMLKSWIDGERGEQEEQEQEQEEQLEGGYRGFVKNWDDMIHTGRVVLTRGESSLLQVTARLTRENSSHANSIKDELTEQVHRCKYLQDGVLDSLFKLSMRTIAGELELTKILRENYTQRSQLKEQRIMKSTVNKVLAPKAIMNPYLNSPLLPESEFFAANLKLGYVDHFLNKLKNRAVAIELAEGGFGFLLKVPELDECVQSLCKGMITFSEKYFHDRFRTFVESYDEMREKLGRTETKLKNLESVVSVCRHSWQKELTSMLYNKLNESLSLLHEKYKAYQQIFNTLRSLEIYIAGNFDSKYQQRVSALESYNAMLREQFAHNKLLMLNNTNSGIEEAKEKLYNVLKRESEGILNKEILKKYEKGDVGDRTKDDLLARSLKGAGCYRPAEGGRGQSLVLMDKLKCQKIFYGLKLASVEAKYSKKISELSHKLSELSTLTNSLAVEQYKNAELCEQVKLLHGKEIEVETLEKSMAAIKEEEWISRFKLLKINENLTGKVARYEQEREREKSLAQERIQSEEARGEYLKERPVQSKLAEQPMRYKPLSYANKTKGHRFRIRTYTSAVTASNSIANDVQIWRQKWENSERKFQYLSGRIVSLADNYKFTRNWQILVEKISRISESLKQ